MNPSLVHFIESHRVTPERGYAMGLPPEFTTTSDAGFNGLFIFVHGGRTVKCIISDGEGWKHVSVSIQGSTNPPTWPIMCWVKQLFWAPDKTVVQYHPAEKDYVNFHEGCLHLWECLDREFPTPPPNFVGPK